MATSETTSLHLLLSQCAAVRVDAMSTGNTQLCTLARYLGKAMLLLEALLNGEHQAANTSDIFDDFLDALSSITDVITSVRSMSRLQALIHEEDIRDGLRAATADLRCAVETLSPHFSSTMNYSLPPDTQEDFKALQRQLAALRLVPRTSTVQAASNLLQAVVLDYCLGDLDGRTIYNGDSLEHRTRSTPLPRCRENLGDAVHAALAHVGLSLATAGQWMHEEMLSLVRGAMKAGDSEDSDQDAIDALHLYWIAVALLRWSMGKNPYTKLSNGDSKKRGHSLEERINVSCRSESSVETQKRHKGVLTAIVNSSLSQHTIELSSCPICEFGITDETMDEVSKTLDLMETFKSGRQMALDDAEGLRDALMAGQEELRETGKIQGKDLLLKYQAAVLIDHAADVGYAQQLLEANIIPAVLEILETSGHSNLRAVTATALRTLCRDPAAREAAVSSGCIRPLARYLQSPHAAPRRAAARALSNVIVAGEEWKREAVERFSITQSLVVMLRSDDALGQEASASALANLAANSEAVQTAIGKTDVFAPLSVVLQNNSAPSSQIAAARALRNLTSRVHANKLRANAAGVITSLVSLLESSDPAARASAASTLATLSEGCIDAANQAFNAGAEPLLLSMLEESNNLACQEAAASALVPIIMSYNVLPIPAEYGGGMMKMKDETGLINLILYHAHILVDLLSVASPGGRRAAARLLACLARKKGKYEVVEAGAVPPLVALLSNKQDLVRRSAAEALHALLYHCDAGKQALLAANGIPPLVDLLNTTKPEEEQTRYVAARVVGILCSYNKFHQGAAVAKAGAIPALCSILNIGSPASREAAAMALSNLACLASNQQALEECGAAPLLLKLLTAEATPGCRQAAARGLSNMVADGVPKQLTSAISDMVVLLSELALSGDHVEESQIAAAGALGNLACADSDAADAVARYGGAATLASLCRSETPAVREVATQGLWETCRSSEEARKVAVSEGVVPWLVHTLIVGKDSAKEAAAGCLAELTRVGESVCLEAERAGALFLLEGLAGHSNPEVAGAASAALRAIENRSPDSPSVEVELSRRLSSLRQVGSKRWDSGMSEEIVADNDDNSTIVFDITKTTPFAR